MKKFLLTMSVLMAVAGLAGCGADSGDTGSENGGTAAVEVNRGFNATGLPIADEPITLSVTTMRWGAMGDTFTQNTWLQELEERTNVIIDWNVVSSSEWSEVRSLMLLSGDLPDIFLGHMTIEDGQVMANLHQFMELSGLIENYMPNYQAAMAAVPELRAITTYPDGGIYSFAHVLPGRPVALGQPVINTVWLNNLGLAAPTSLDELANVLRAFRDNDPNGNGVNDEIPYTFSGDIDRNWFVMFGISDINGTDMHMVNGVPYYWPASDNYREAIRWLHSIWSEGGIFDPVGFTQDASAANNKRANDEIPLVGFMFAWSNNALTAHWAYQYEIIAPIASPIGRFAEGDFNGILALERNSAHITTGASHPEVAARWLDQFYDPEATIQNFWGAFNTVITPHEDGTFSLNNPPEGVSADAWYWDQSLRDFGPGYVPPGFNERLIFNPAEGDGRKLADSQLAEPYVIQDNFPRVIFTVEENEQLAIIGAELSSHVEEMRARWITQGGIDEEWDQYIAHLQTIGLDEFTEIHRVAFERFRAAQ